MTKRTLAIVSFVAASVVASTALLCSAADKTPPKPAAPAETMEMTMAASEGAAKPGTLSTEQTAFFESKVRPLLAEHCYKCHSADSQKVKGNLLLDTRDASLKGGDTGPAVVPGNVEASLLIKAITYKDADLQMPPKGEKLPDEAIATLTEWVKMGAPDPRTGPSKMTGMNDKARNHWAYKAVVKPAVPAVKAQKMFVRNDVDNFIIAKLEQQGFQPSRTAGKEALLRRVTFDLTGLPPTPHEVREFLIDSSPKSWERVVDRLLASPHYGERWGRFWLDSARYADTTGNDQQGKDYRYAYAWTYRDYVIKAFNDDKPYDQFLKEQLAADQLPDADKHADTLAALGFLTVGRRFPNVNDTIDERIDTISKGMQGMTVACARCHDHKFDPIPTADYYSLHGILSSVMEPKDLPVVGHGDERLAADFYNKKKEIEQKDREIFYDVVEKKNAEFRKKTSDYLWCAIYNRHQTGENEAKKRELITKKMLDTDLIQHVRLRNDSVVGPLEMFDAIGEGNWAEQSVEVLNHIQANDGHKINPRVVAAFKGQSPRDLKDVVEIYAKIFTGLDADAKTYLDANKKATAKDATVSGFDGALVAILNYPDRAEPSNKLTSDHLRDIAGDLGIGNNPTRVFKFGAINELELTNNGGDARAMVVVDSNPHDDPIFIKGEQNHHGDTVPRRFFEIIAGPDRKPFTKGSGRLELAQCIADKTNPLTARVMVNRIWLHHFGEGFVRTPDDLGVQSEAPVNQELLDYLSARFMEDGWSIKKLHKLILMSGTYQQSSDNNAAYTLKDPENKYLWRQNLRRLDFEAIRDSMLVFTGQLDESVGGRPVNLTDEPYSNRRSVYGYVDRGSVPELLAQFDFSDPNRANSRRTSTIVPQQALFFMNSSMSADVARKLIQRPEFLRGGTDAGRVQALYYALFSRDARPAEVSLAAEFFNAHDPRKVTLFSRPGKSMSEKPTKDAMDSMMNSDGKRAIRNDGEVVEKKPLSLWEQYAQALLFTNEVVYVN